MDSAALSAILTAAGVRFAAVGGPTEAAAGRTILDRSGFPLRIDGLHEDDLAAAQAALDAHPLDVGEARRIKLAEIDTRFRDEIAAGYLDEPTGLLMSLEDSPRGDRTSHLGALQLRLMTGTATLADTMPVSASNGVQVMAIGSYFALLGRYGTRYESLRTLQQTLTLAVQDADTPQAVAAIAWPARDHSQDTPPAI